MPASASQQFGTRPNVPFITRPGSYAVFFNESAQAGIVRTDRGDYFLAGGGIEEGEAPPETLHRELLEEAGIVKASIQAFIGEVVEYHHEPSNGLHYRKEGHFYLVRPELIIPERKIEEDHTLLWLPVEQAMGLLYHRAYSWALERGYRMWKKMR